MGHGDAPADLPAEGRERDEALERAYAAVDAGDVAGLPAGLAANPLFASPFWSVPLLEYAIESGNAAVVGGLLRAGVPADALNEHGWSSLMVAASVGSVEIVRLLLAAGADPDVLPERYDRDVDPSSYGRSALYLALARGNREIVDLLIPVTRAEVRTLAEEAIARDLSDAEGS